MSALAFKIEPSPSSNDHQTRVLIDGQDLLGKDDLGVDPPRFFAQQSLTAGGELLIGRCSCGCEGCGDTTVHVQIEENQVWWIDARGLRLHFERQQYDLVVKAGREDFSWEDCKRAAERLVEGVFSAVSLNDGFKFDWASARIRDDVMTLSFTKSGAQKLLEFSWDGQSPQSALKAAIRFREDDQWQEGPDDIS